MECGNIFKSRKFFFNKNNILVRTFTDKELINCLRITIPFELDILLPLLKQALTPRLVCLDMDGVLYRNEYQYRYKIKQENKGLSDAQVQARNENRYQVTMIDGNLYQIRNQTQNQIREQIKLGDNIVVNPDGTYQLRDRKQLRLQDGECLNASGEMFKNTYTYRKMNTPKSMVGKKIMNKNQIQKKTQAKKKNVKSKTKN
mgnify:CR=1 FL=1